MNDGSFGEAVHMKNERKRNQINKHTMSSITEQGLRCYRMEEIYHDTKTILSFFS